MLDSSPGGYIHHHLWKFFDIMDRLSKMDTKIDDDLLTVIIQLTSSFENVRCVMES